jgi:hypothetical protein
VNISGIADCPEAVADIRNKVKKTEAFFMPALTIFPINYPGFG